MYPGVSPEDSLAAVPRVIEFMSHILSLDASRTLNMYAFTCFIFQVTPINMKFVKYL